MIGYARRMDAAIETVGVLGAGAWGTALALVAIAQAGAGGFELTVLDHGFRITKKISQSGYECIPASVKRRRESQVWALSAMPGTRASSTEISRLALRSSEAFETRREWLELLSAATTRPP